jgi:anti-anti-sigma regulatory factor
MLRVDRSDEGRICLLSLEGNLGSSDLVNLAERLRGLAARGVLRVVVDLRRVEHWDYRGLASLAEAVDYRRSAGAVTAFIAPRGYLRDIAAAANVLDRLDLYDDLRLETEAETIPLKVVELVPQEAGLRRASGL